MNYIELQGKGCLCGCLCLWFPFPASLTIHPDLLPGCSPIQVVALGLLGPTTTSTIRSVEALYLQNGVRRGLGVQHRTGTIWTMITTPQTHTHKSNRGAGQALNKNLLLMLYTTFIYVNKSTRGTAILLISVPLHAITVVAVQDLQISILLETERYIASLLSRLKCPEMGS